MVLDRGTSIPNAAARAKEGGVAFRSGRAQSWQKRTRSTARRNIRVDVVDSHFGRGCVELAER